MAQKKATIIKVSDDKVSIGMEDGSFFDVSRKELNFLPSIGDEVSVFSNGDMKIVSKLETSTKKILPKEQNFQNYGNENVFAEYAPDQNIFSQLDGKSKTGLVLGICGALAILVAIIIGLANVPNLLEEIISSNPVEDAYNAGYEIGFSTSRERDSANRDCATAFLLASFEPLLYGGCRTSTDSFCSEAAEQFYIQVYGAPMTAEEKVSYREIKATFHKGCLAGAKAARE
jgi:hypothetical protein